MKRLPYIAGLAIVLSLFKIGTVAALEGEFSLVSYNVAGIVQFLASGNPKKNTKTISKKLNQFDLALFQEDFHYHKDLKEYANHPYKTDPKGLRNLYSDGLNRFSRFPYRDFNRHNWKKCYGIARFLNDCMTPKGFSVARHTMAPGIEIDIYNVHADAGDERGDKRARRHNFKQLLETINKVSVGHAVIVVGDTNSKFSFPGEAKMLLDAGFKNAWIEKVNGGIIPKGEQGEDKIDKIFYRSGQAVKLSLTKFKVLKKEFTLPNGEQLSDHDPLFALFRYYTGTNSALIGGIGGNGGVDFIDLDNKIGSKIKTIAIRSGRRINQIKITYDTGEVLRHGGYGGLYKQLKLKRFEVIVAATVCSAEYRSITKKEQRIYYIKISTNYGRHLSGGRYAGNCQSFKAPKNWEITGFWGRSGKEINKLGIIATKSSTIKTESELIKLKNIGFYTKHKRYLSAKNIGGRTLFSNRRRKGSWETFDLILTDSKNRCIRNGDKVAISTQHGYFLSSNRKGDLHAKSQAINLQEKFTVINHSNANGCLKKHDKISLKSLFNRFIDARKFGRTKAKSSEIGKSEILIIK